MFSERNFYPHVLGVEFRKMWNILTTTPHSSFSLFSSSSKPPGELRTGPQNGSFIM